MKIKSISLISEEVVMVPSEIPPEEMPQHQQQGTPYYQPHPPATGYPPPPFGNPYANPDTGYNPTSQQTAPFGNPYQVKESKFFFER